MVEKTDFVAFDPVVHQLGIWKVTLKWDGEGLWGRYSTVPEDEDRQMLRFVIERRNGNSWEAFGTNTTYILASDTREVIEKSAEMIAKACVADARKPAELVAKLGYLHLTPKGPAIDVPIDSELPV